MMLEVEENHALASDRLSQVCGRLPNLGTHWSALYLACLDLSRGMPGPLQSRLTRLRI